MRRPSYLHGHPLRMAPVPQPPQWARPARPTNAAAVARLHPVKLAEELKLRGLRPTVVRDLVEQRHTAGAKWRITQELEL